MRTPTSPTGPFFGALKLYLRCLPGLLSMSLVEASSRAVQLGAFGDISGALYALLEVLVWAARVGIILVVAGEGNPFRCLEGFRALQASMPKKPVRWAPKIRPLAIRVSCFAVLALTLNALVGRAGEAIASQHYAAFLDDPEPIVFFLKNMTTIPLTLVFAYQVYRFIVSDLKRAKQR